MRRVTTMTSTRGACAKNESSPTTPSRATRESGTNPPSNALWKLAAAIATVLSAAAANASPGPCVAVDGKMTCTGDQSGGIDVEGTAYVPAITQLDVRDVAPGTKVGRDDAVAVRFNTRSGSSITLNVGDVGQPLAISTTGPNAQGIYANSVGLLTRTRTIAALGGLVVPAEGAGGGGPVVVNNYADIATKGAGATGVFAQNRIGGYSDAMVASMNAFLAKIASDPNAYVYTVHDVADSTANVGSWVNGDNGGRFLLRADGTFEFDSLGQFGNLASGEVRDTKVRYTVHANGVALGTATLVHRYGFEKDGTTRAERSFVQFDDFAAQPTVVGDALRLFPDMKSYVEDLLADAGVGGSGAALEVTNYGSIATYALGTHGMVVQTLSGAGAPGYDGCIVCGEPSRGGKGASGGTVRARNDGTIYTDKANAVGILAQSVGGVGGQGGDGSWWYYGRMGGDGGDGGSVYVEGDGSITTRGNSAIGVYALSAGGPGGPGGEGSWWNGGGNGAIGGVARDVHVLGALDVDTKGIGAHAIWAQSVGGSGGAGGETGWWGTAASGSGAGAMDGGSVEIDSAGTIVTRGQHAYGIYAQSVGGFGGAGGNAIGLFVGWGGNGGNAGRGGNVSVTQQASGSIRTDEAYSHAIFAQSIGGGGGTGGSSFSLSGLGGDAGSGGHGGTVSVENLGTIDTMGFRARGIYAQSIGGGGGDGGSSTGVVSLGGSGGAASNAGAVTVTNAGRITTGAADANAVHAQSIGGGGGSGGTAIGAVSFGGGGAGGGDGSTVNVTNTLSGEIRTAGDRSRGIFAQSIGGGGGDGGGSGAGVMSFGGTGAGGGDAKLVKIENDGLVTTRGASADAVYAQSVGGGGGSGGASGALAIALGGNGGGGGDGGMVDVTNDGTLSTSGLFARGVFAQSVGGGGGDGAGAGGGFDAIGGNGGTAGAGNTVLVTNTGAIATDGAVASGVFAQSVGGGGGSGAGAGAVFEAIGGKGGAGGAGGLVLVKNWGSIGTAGLGAKAVFAQSVGGGGGSGGGVGAVFNAIGGDAAEASDGGNVTVANMESGTLTTTGDVSAGVYAQSIGGGGGSGAGSGGLIGAIGGKGGTAGKGGIVWVMNDGAIATSGLGSQAVFAQSIGGGGGDGGGAGALLGSIGGSGGAGGAGGDVTIENRLTGRMTTTGHVALGVYAQSVGGGGGNGAGAGAAGLAIGGSGAGGGLGGKVTVTNAGAIDTTGFASRAVFAQSVGGGGGNGAGAGAMLVSIGGSGARAGDGGNVTITNTGTGSMTTSGAFATGVYAQSVGGGGGTGAGSGALALAIGGSGGVGGIGGEVTVTNAGSIETSGFAAQAVYAQSVGGGGGSGGGSGAVLAAIGGQGAAASDGGKVTVTNTVSGTLRTSNEFATGVYAQSIGGGGGTGAGSGSAGLAIGGDGGGGGNGGWVGLTNAGEIVTTGFASQAVYAQSVGGGGGNGGGTGALLAALGGDGGVAGDGGALVLTNESTGTIETRGFYSAGVYAQSVGGGGGSGAGAGAVAAALGGDGGAQGSGGDITFTNAGRVLTIGDVSTGVYAQSIGGGGGSGGSSGALFASIGGDGGSAKDAAGKDVATGNGGDIKFTNTGTIETRGFYSQGVKAQSVGGGGGSAGSTGAWFASIGGDGGTGGDGGLVDFTNKGAVKTSGSFSTAVFAQSVGGGGGDGGSSGGFFAAIGGDGSQGGHGGYVSVTNEGTLVTTGVGSRGVHAESIGGGGGTGGGSGALYVAVGGDGGAADYGGDVDVTNTGRIDTSGGLAHAVYASSIGGGGGSASRSGAGMVAIGGSGGDGGAGGSVEVTNEQDLITRGAGSFGVYAQSVGGGGGNGGGVLTITPTPGFSIGVAVGGSGGNGGVGKDVVVSNTGLIETGGPNSHGVFAQSVGGGGGVGGNALAISAAIGGVIEQMPISWSAAVTVGGSGGNGGLSDLVTVHQNGGVHTRGFRSYGVLAQSVGGSGGDGGNASSIVLSVNTDIAATVAVGGSGGDAGTGGAVQIDGTGEIVTEGAHAVGVLAQSVGGSGGTGGDSSTTTVSLSIPTGWGDLKPSLGGQLDLSLGGDGGGGGNAGRVDVLGSNTVYTKGSFASGVLAQSVGGSGGVGGAARSFQFEATLNPTDYLPLLDIFDVGAKIVLGGDGGRGGNGGVVNVAGATSVTTQGAFGYGLLAQSVGGGGGAAGSAFDFEFSTTDIIDYDSDVIDEIGKLLQYESVLEGDAGAPGNGGAVTVTNAGDIRTRGPAAYGVVAQSVAGGGGIAGLYNPIGVSTTSFGPQMRGWLETVPGAGVSFLGSLGGGGNAGAVVVDYDGSIVTTGKGAHAIVAQSAAGEGSASSVSVRLDGTFGATGLDAHGVYAQSIGTAGAGAVNVDVLAGSTLVGGGGRGAAVYVADGASNTIANYGTLRSSMLIGGNAIVATGGSDHVKNRGTLIGNVDLGGGANALDNTGRFDTGAVLNVGAGNLVSNAGVVSPGGAGTVFATTLAGDYVQTADGAYVVDVDVGRNAIDRIDVTGAASVAGDLRIGLLDAGAMVPGVHGLTLLTAAGGLVRDGVLLESSPSAVVQYGMQVVNGTQLQLRYTVDFAPDGLPSNGHSFGEYINRVQLAGSTTAMKPLVVAFVAQATVPQLAYVYERLSPTAYLTDQGQRFWSSISFDQALHSCRVRDGDLRFSREGECTWLRTDHNQSRRDAANGVARVKESTTSVEGGWQKAIGARWHAGLALGYEDGELDIPGVSTRDGKLYEIGAILKGRYAGNLFTISGSFGYGDQQVRREIDVPTAGVEARGDRNVRLAALHVRYSHDFESRNVYLRPALDAGATTLHAGGFTETGAGAANLRVASETQTYTTLEPTLEIGGEHAFPGGTLFRPYARVGYTKLLSGDDPHVAASLEGAPTDVAPFTATMALDDGLTTWSVGMDFLTRGGTVVQFGYTGRRAGDWHADGAFAKLAVGF